MMRDEESAGSLLTKEVPRKRKEKVFHSFRNFQSTSWRFPYNELIELDIMSIE